MSRNIYIFDLDDTLYKKENDSPKLISIVDKDLLSKLNGKKIIFSNATYEHCSKVLTNLVVINQFNIILSADMLKDLKPNMIVYRKVVDLCGLTNKDNIYFFENLGLNLFNAHNLGWKTIHIDQEYHQSNPKSIKSCDKIQFIDMTYNNVNDAITKFID